MKIGDEVQVISGGGSYGGKYCCKTGHVERFSDGQKKLGVRLNNITNPAAPSGLFWFRCDEVESVTKPVDKTYAIKKVYFNDPVTVVLWADGTKTIVRCGEDDIYDPEKGLAMAISKKALGNKGNYYNTFKKHLPEEEVDEEYEHAAQAFSDYLNSLFRR